MAEQNLNLNLQTKLSQKLAITPQMKQSLSLLQMPITDLIQEISSYLEDNPLLEISEEYKEPESIASSEENSDKDNKDELFEEISSYEWEDYMNGSGNSNELSFTPLTPEEELADYEQYIPSSLSLHEFLMFQLKVLGLKGQDEHIGEIIIGNLTEDGYFLMDIEPLAAQLCVTADDFNRVLSYIQSFDPVGIAAVSLADCVLRQLPDLGASPGEILQVKELFDNFSSELENYRYDEIEKKAGLDRDSFTDLLSMIKKTDPRPGLSFSGRGNCYVYPDVYIVRHDDNFDVVLNEHGVPSLKLSNHYMKFLRDSQLDTTTRSYLENKVKGAVWVLKSLQKRQKAIYKVSKAIVDIQEEYLLKGEAYLKPLRLKDIADITGLHESTVSRVTSGKYALSDRGLIELKSFFSKGMDSSDGDVSTRSIKLLVREIVDTEPHENPHSDEMISKLLAEKGVDVARRTVAKYRDELGILTKSQRKRMRR